ncbi:MAG: NAD(P)/FAD-dependent oxidoreductase [Proteobacteria bacterium]|nr:NAD(P)/FAD-dependent oxidoreductase [Pseudomonadota bacterium]
MPVPLRPAHFDVVIVGASFAGLVAARTAAMRGLKVAILEAKKSPGARVATSGILVKEAADEIDLPYYLTRTIHGVRLYAPNLRSIDLFAPGYFFLTTRTGALLEWLAREAIRSGVRLYAGCRFDGATREGPLIRLANLDLTTRYLIGADGARSHVARSFGLGINHKFLVGVEAEYENLTGIDQRFLHCFVDSRLAPGYIGWVAPGPTAMQVGLATNDAASPDLAAFVTKTSTLFDYRASSIVERRAGRIPAGGIVHPIAAPGVMLIGDAAGMVSPMTGGGIRLAFQFGRRAAQAVADHLQHLGPAPEVALARELPSFALKGLMRRALDLAPPNALIDLGLGTALMRRLATRIYFHRRGAGSLPYAEFERRLRAVEAPSPTDDSACATPRSD